MFKVGWDIENNSIILSDSIEDKDEIVPPRPVFFEELQKLGFDEYFDYRENKAPLCWAIDKRYFYKGAIIAEVKGGDLYHDAIVIPNENCRLKELYPVDIKTTLEINNKAIFALENEAMDFVKEKFDKYSEKVMDFVVAFSGGKDSQVILDIVSRVLPPENYKVVFTDTGMELPCTHDTINNTERYYRKKYPKFNIEKAKSDKQVIDLWKNYGPPSRINRWCCSVLKTALFGRKMKELLSTSSQPKVVVFEGVRADESTKRESYSRVGEGVKHVNITNCRAIFKWNTTEIFLYIFGRQIDINPAYRMGLTRVGCSICPFASDWSEFLIQKIYPEIARQYIDVIELMAKNIGITNKLKIDDYVSSGNWKKNAGGKGLTHDDSRIDIISKEPIFECIVSYPKTSWQTWLRTIGDYIINKFDDVTSIGELKCKNEVIKFQVKCFDNKIIFKAYETTNKILIISLLSKAFTKTAFCERCGVCEAECPTGALTVNREFALDIDKCKNCNNCFSINTKGCIIATRKVLSEGGIQVLTGSTKTSGIDKYSTFGLREVWLNAFFDLMDGWFIGFGNLGKKQIPAMINWLREAELVDRKDKKVTELAALLKNVYSKSPLTVWQIIWINLSFNSAIVNWYVSNVRENIPYSKIILLENLKTCYPNLSDGTLGNPIDALINTFNNSPLGHELKLGVAEKPGNITKSITKIGTEKISSIAVCYLLYKVAESKNTYEMTVSDFYEKRMFGIVDVFNMPTESFLNALRSLTDKGILTADLVGGLDNIHLNNEYTSHEVLKKLV